MIKRVLLLAAICGLGGPAHAAGPAPAAESSSDEPVELYNALTEAANRAQDIFGPDETCPRNLDTPAVVVPVVEHERLAGYAFVVPRICLKRSGRFDHLSSVHFLTDRFVRAAHRAPFELNGEGELVRAETEAAFLDAAGEFIQPGDIERLDLLGEDIRYLR